jgi:hypothetical protein
MSDSTKYDNLVNFFLNNWLIAILVALAVIIGFIPNLRDGILELIKWLKIKKNEEFKIMTEGETIIFQIKTSSKLFDIVKVNAITHNISVNAEYRWIKKYYPKYKVILQGLEKIPIDNDQFYYDVVTISNNEGKEKIIYFDITSFFNENGSTSYDRNKFIQSKIIELHKIERKS